MVEFTATIKKFDKQGDKQAGLILRYQRLLHQLTSYPKNTECFHTINAQAKCRRAS
jgi:hypothetical protein